MNEPVIREFYVGFRNASYFVRRFLKKDFQHVYILYKDRGKWIEFDPRNHALEIFVLPFEESMEAPQLLTRDHGHHFLRVKVKWEGRKNPNLNIFKTLQCVNVTKYILGISVRAFTPYGLYKRLATMRARTMAKKGILEIEVL